MTREDVDFISGMNMCDEISNEAYKKIMCHCEEQKPCEDEIILTKEEYGELVSSEFDNGYAKGYREALEQDSALDKIKAEIEALPKTYPFVNHIDMYVKVSDVTKIIDKYKAGSE